MIHTCEEKCATCGYYCDLEIGHYETKGTLHDCVHGNMRNAVCNLNDGTLRKLYISFDAKYLMEYGIPYNQYAF